VLFHVPLDARGGPTCWRGLARTGALWAAAAVAAAAPAATQAQAAGDVAAATSPSTATRDSAPRPTAARAVRPVGSRPVALRPGDVVKLYVWREPEMSRDYEVGPSGQVEFPKLGPVDVAGLSPDSLKRFLEVRFARFIREPSVEVSMRRRISVLGSVRNPGVLYVDPYVTVAEALAMAGGTTPEARTDHVRVLRDNRALHTRVSTRTPLADSPVQSGDQLYVPDRGWAARNVGLISAVISAGGALVFALRR
jgi:polysaccharide export outer membrane protein